ncbi:uncharacterized protein [Ptychodera flava]|uniref:uncharacterized protein n=1 Tax=Ptychodera flava TaxID=63121 RepID=UPI00396AA9F2
MRQRDKNGEDGNNYSSTEVAVTNDSIRRSYKSLGDFCRSEGQSIIKGEHNKPGELVERTDHSDDSQFNRAIMPRNEHTYCNDPFEYAVANAKIGRQYQSLRDFSRDDYQVLNKRNERRPDEHVGIYDEINDPQRFECQTISRHKRSDKKDTSEYAVADIKPKRPYQSLRDFSRDEHQNLVKGKVRRSEKTCGRGQLK